ncbi:hypothetical protein GCM10008927_08940 [Amylibacter ulvae]|uniref:Cyclic nucleotide-binding domain-containing protein n=1 Tax=Paramylibacter ulvae TaxID=1651968 RepID=A0ABQ3CY27_9RHOB|nr:cyclic nucleotide-binding domain-containing protein [Amylibacter ulvae]GHA45999.1 hypothetical protein GCM10008927_08940 [Amylibacter ulvae]
MVDYIFSAAILVHFALLFFSLGFLARDQLILRGLVLIGSAFYILYYFNINDTPLWDAIFASGTMALINFAMICTLILERTTFAMNSDQSVIYQCFPTLTPGQFRKVMRDSETTTASGQTVLCETGHLNERLYLLVAGKAVMYKGGVEYNVPLNSFIGEVGFLNQSAASASVTAQTGAVFVYWQVSDLRKMMRRSAPLNNALIALFSTDLARKVERSQPMADTVKFAT